MGDRNVQEVAVEPEHKQDVGASGGGYKPPSPRDLARASDFRVARIASDVPSAQRPVEFDEDSFLNEELEGDETCVATSHIDLKKVSSATDEEDDFLTDEEATRLSQTGVRRTLRPRGQRAVDVDDFDVDVFEEETRLSERDIFSGPTSRPQPLEKKTG